MPNQEFIVLECAQSGCQFRFPAPLQAANGLCCPRCGSPTLQLTVYENPHVEIETRTRTEFHVEALLDNIRSAFNVGSMLRIADGCGIQPVHLCGISATPDNPKVAKTALSSEWSLPWEYSPNGLQSAHALKAQGLALWALEGGPNSSSLFDVVANINQNPGLTNQAGIVLIAGNEVTGVDPDILALCDQVVYLPMMGFKRSLNVAVAFGIAAYTLRFNIKPSSPIAR